jgi:ribosomal-protein-alanine N-acetyltransferase
MFGFFQRDYASHIARLDTTHADACAAVHATSFSYAWPPADIEALLLANSTFADGAFGKVGDLQGFILSRRAADEAEILTIAVQPKKRGHGIAGRLMRANMSRLQAAGARSWFLEVEAQNAAALALYRRFGFEKVGERKSYYRKPDGDSALAYVLRRALA